MGLSVLIAMILFFVIFHFVKKRRETNENRAYLEGDDSAKPVE
jgi:hypothetical protein